jgi:quercetin dioxygenase-like cupin family protein
VPATPLYWHRDGYPTLDAAHAARRGRGTVAEAHGRVWLFTIAEADWRPQGGQRVARVGPPPLKPGRAYTAYYIEGVVPQGARTPPHRHAGPEAWYVLEGTNCLETPEGVRTATAGQSLIVPEGPPMVLTGVGPTIRRSMAVIVLRRAAVDDSEHRLDAERDVSALSCCQSRGQTPLRRGVRLLSGGAA